MKPVPIKIPPGFYRNGTDYESSGRWFKGNLVRWENGRLKPWGGWRSVMEQEAAFTGVARGGIAWRTARGYYRAAFGTNSNLYFYDDGVINDQTPAGFVGGSVDTEESPGYGAGPYNEGNYSDPDDDTVTVEAATWQFDIYGDLLLGVCSSDGRCFEWAASGVAIPTPLENAPVDNVGVLVTNEGHIMLLGSGGDRRLVQWCSNLEKTVWTPASTNTAGSRTLKTNGYILTGRLFNGSPIIFTTADVHRLDYLGYPLVYSNICVGEQCGVIGPNAVGGTHDALFWMTKDGFFSYDGIVRQLPCDLQDAIFGSTESGIAAGINLVQGRKVYCSTNYKKSEVIWFYPSAGSDENDRYVAYNYKYKIWYDGELARTVWIDAGVFDNPQAVAPNGTLYEHEITYLADGEARENIYAQSGPAEIGGGERVIYTNNMIPDAKNGENIELSLLCKTAPGGYSQTYGPYSVVPNSEGFVAVRAAGRQVALRVEQVADGDWSLGTVRFMSAGGGGR